jgi:hypothetical protein
MESLASLLAAADREHGYRNFRTEYRDIEMYTAKNRSAAITEYFQAQTGQQAMLSTLSGLWSLLTLLEAEFCQQQPELLEGVTGWQRYQQLSKRNRTEKIIAECYRILRVIRIAWIHPEGEIKQKQGVIECGCNCNEYPVLLRLTQTGVDLLQTLVQRYLERRNTPYGERYHEAILQNYYQDLLGEIRGFEDEDRALCQFRTVLKMNRHVRLNCRNPRYEVCDGYCVIQLGPSFDDGQCHPIDFHLRLNDRFYIVPMEAFFPYQPVSASALANSIAMTELSGWACRSDFQPPM